MPRLSILDRHIPREYLRGALAAVVVLLVIFTGSTFADIANKVANGRLPGGVMFTVPGPTLVNTSRALLPMGMFPGVPVALGRMYRDSELHVLSASGFGPPGLLKPTAIFAIGTWWGLLSVFAGAAWVFAKQHATCNPLDLAEAGA